MTSRSRPVDSTGTTVLITGASSGLGAQFATQLARAHPRPSVVSGLTSTATAILARLPPRRITLNSHLRCCGHHAREVEDRAPRTVP